MKRVVCVGAHPLDAELMGGPLLIKYAKTGARCTYVHVVQGRLDEDSTQEEKSEYKVRLSNEIREVALSLGGDSFCFEYDSANMPSNEDFIETLVKYFISEEVELVVTHHSGTLHPRHYYTHYCTTEAVRRCRELGHPIQLLYGENCEDLIGFIPQAYYELSEEEVKIWFASLNKYTIFRGLVNEVPYLNYYTTMGKIRAMEAGTQKFMKAYMYASLIEKI